MTAPTHIAFAVVCSLVAGVESKPVLYLVAGGALLPDIDHPQSAVGRVLFFLSYPLNKLFGHRGFVHSLVLWIPFTLLGFLWTPFFYIGGGAISHTIIDAWNLSGVALLHPITEKIFVLAKKQYRLATASRGEFILLIVLLMLAWGTGYIGSRGGLRSILLSFLGNYSMAVEAYQREGTAVCFMEGKLRYPDGNIEEGRWLIIGTDSGKDDLCIFDTKKNKVMHIPKQAMFLKAVTKKTEKTWHTMRLTAPAMLKEGYAFFNPSKQWHRAGPGDSVFGYVIYEEAVTLGQDGL
jgi:inner membrane protein